MCEVRGWEEGRKEGGVECAYGAKLEKEGKAKSRILEASWVDGVLILIFAVDFHKCSRSSHTVA